MRYVLCLVLCALATAAHAKEDGRLMVVSCDEPATSLLVTTHPYDTDIAIPPNQERALYYPNPAPEAAAELPVNVATCTIYEIAIAIDNIAADTDGGATCPDSQGATFRVSLNGRHAASFPNDCFGAMVLSSNGLVLGLCRYWEPAGSRCEVIPLRAVMQPGYEPTIIPANQPWN